MGGRRRRKRNRKPGAGAAQTGGWKKPKTLRLVVGNHKGKPATKSIQAPPWRDVVERRKAKKVGTRQLKELPHWAQPEGIHKREMAPAVIPRGAILNKGKPLVKDRLYLVNSKEEKKERRQTKERFALQELIRARNARKRPDLSKGERFLQGLMEEVGVEPYKLVHKVNLASVIPKLKDTSKRIKAWKNLSKSGKEPGTKRRRNNGSAKLAAIGLMTGEYSEETARNGDVRILAKSRNITRKCDLGEVARAAGFSHIRHLKAALEATNKVCKLLNINLDGEAVGEAPEAVPRAKIQKIFGKAWALGTEVDAIVTAYSTGLINHPTGKLFRDE